MLTTLTNDVRAEVARAWLEAPDVAGLGIEENDELTFAETMAAIVEAETERVSEDPLTPPAVSNSCERGLDAADVRALPGRLRVETPLRGGDGACSWTGMRTRSERRLRPRVLGSRSPR